MKKLIYLVLVLVFAVQCTSPKSAETSTGNTAEAPATISIKEQVKQNAFLVDVRSPEEFAAGSVKGAVNIPLNEVESRVAEFQNKPYVIVFCRSGNRSGQAKSILEEKGIKNVTNGINVDHIENELK